MSDFLERWASDNQANSQLVAEERLILEVTEGIWTILDEKQISKADLAGRLNKSKAYISQLLNGNRNMTLRTLADIVHVLGANIDISWRYDSAKNNWFEGSSNVTA